jgi:hypothetical protein
MKKEAKKKLYKGLVVPQMAIGFVQKAQQELFVIESNLASYQAIARRVRPSLNTRFTKADKKTMEKAIDIMKKHRDEYKKVEKAWKPYVTKRTDKPVALPTFPVRHANPKRLVGAINDLFKYIYNLYEEGALNNKPILPVKQRVVNLRGKTIRQANAMVNNVQKLQEELVTCNKQKKKLLEELHNLRMWIAFHNSNNNNRPPGWK